MPPIGLNRAVHHRLGEMLERAANGLAARDSGPALSRLGTADSLRPLGKLAARDIKQSDSWSSPAYQAGRPDMSSRVRTKLKRADAVLLLRRCGLSGLLFAPLLLSACAVSTLSNPFRSGSEDTSASAVTPDKLLETAKADNGTDLPGGNSAHCPQVVAWPRDRLLTIYQPGHVGDQLAVVHRGEITKMARECQLYSDRVVVKYGFAGRVLLGPKGAAGAVTLPVSIRVAGSDQKTLATDKMTITTTVPPGDPAGYFSMVREIAFPIQMGTRPEDYKVFVAFDRTQANAG